MTHSVWVFCVSASSRWSICLSFRMMWRIAVSVCVRLDLFHIHTHIWLNQWPKIADFATVRMFYRNFLFLWLFPLFWGPFFCKANVQLAVHSDMCQICPHTVHSPVFSFAPVCVYVSQSPWHMKTSWWVVHMKPWPMQHNICGLSPCTHDTLTPILLPFPGKSRGPLSAPSLLFGEMEPTSAPLRQKHHWAETGTETPGQWRSLVTATSRVYLFKRVGFELLINACPRTSLRTFKTGSPSLESFLIFSLQHSDAVLIRI